MDKHCTTRADALSVQQSLSLWRDIWAQPLGCHPSDNRFFGPPLHGHPPLGTCICAACGAPDAPHGMHPPGPATMVWLCKHDNLAWDADWTWA